MQGKSFDLRERVRRMLMLVLPGKSSVAVWGSP
jgi:hypothetical protein